MNAFTVAIESALVLNSLPAAFILGSHPAIIPGIHAIYVDSMPQQFLVPLKPLRNPDELVRGRVSWVQPESRYGPRIDRRRRPRGHAPAKRTRLHTFVGRRSAIPLEGHPMVVCGRPNRAAYGRCVGCAVARGGWRL